MQTLSTAIGTATWWEEELAYGKFNGVGEYPLSGPYAQRVVVTKANKVLPPNFDEIKAHTSLRYAYGQMFRGEFWGEPNLVVLQNKPIMEIEELLPNIEVEELIAKYGVENLMVGPVAVRPDQCCFVYSILWCGDKVCRVASVKVKSDED